MLEGANGAVQAKHTRHLPAPDLAEVVEHYWTVRWAFDANATATAQTLPHPSVQLVFEDGAGTVSGVFTEKFTRVLEGNGEVFGIKFSPGGFHGLLNASVDTITNRTIEIQELFGASGDSLARALSSLASDSERFDLADGWLRGRGATADSSALLAARVVHHIHANPSATRVAEVATTFGMRQRTLERLFRRYVGVGPKWVIQRYRLHEAAAQLAGGRRGMSSLALELGYYDQAHFIRDFKAIIGSSPLAYARRSARQAGR